MTRRRWAGACAAAAWAALGASGYVALALFLVAFGLRPGRLRGSLILMRSAPLHLGIALLALAAAFGVVPSPAGVSGGSELARLQARNAVLPSERVATWSAAVPVVGRVPAPPEVSNGAAGPDEADCVRVPPGRSLAHAVDLVRPQRSATGSIYLRAPDGSSPRLRLLMRADGAASPPVTVAPSESWSRASVTLAEGPYRRVALVLFNPHATPADVCATGVQIEEGSSLDPYSSLVQNARPILGREGGRIAAALATAALAYALVLAVGLAGRGAALVPRGGAVRWLGFGLVVQAVAVVPEVVALSRASGFSGHANVLGAQAGLATVLLATVAGPGRLRLVGIVAAVSLVLASGSRMAILGLAAALLVSQGGRIGSWVRSRLGVAAIVATTGALVAVVALRGVPLDAFASGRGVIFAASLEAWTRSLRTLAFGWGTSGAPIGIALAMWPEGARFFAHAHNLLLQVLLQGGVVTALGIGAILAALLRALRPLRRTDLVVATFILVTGLGDVTLLDAQVFALVVGYLGLRIGGVGSGRADG